MTPLAKIVEALLFLSPEPVSLDDLRDATQQDEWAVLDALTELRDGLHGRGVVLKEIGGGWTLASHPGAEEAARRLLSKPRTPTLTPAQAETLSVVAYLQPVSRPEMARIRGVASESATAALAERGLIEEAGRSPFGAVLYRTTPLFLKLFGLRSLEELPELEQWDPSPEDQAALRDRLLRAATSARAPPARQGPPPSTGWSSTSTSSRGRSTCCCADPARGGRPARGRARRRRARLPRSLEARGELDLEAATEFLVLIAALLELKSRLMLRGEEIEELDELEPAEAAEELLERMLRTRASAAPASWLSERGGRGNRCCYRAAPLPPLRRASLEQAEAVYDPAALGAALGGLLRTPPPSTSATWRCRASARRARSRTCARCCARGTFVASTRPSRGADRGDGRRHAVRAARALQARRGELGAGRAVRGRSRVRRAPARTPRGGRDELRRSRRCCSSSPEPGARSPTCADAAEQRRVRRCSTALTRAARRRCDGRGVVLRELAGGWTLASHAGTEEAARRLLARPRTPPLTPAAGRDARDRRLPAAGLAAGDGAHPRRRRGVGRPRALLERGLIEEAGRSQFGASSTARRRCS